LEVDKLLEQIYALFKGFIDPVFIVFILLLVALFACWSASKKKTGVLILLLAIILFYGASIFPTANYLCYHLEKDYIKSPVNTDKNIDAFVVLGGGPTDIIALNNTFLSEITASRLLYAVEQYHKKGATYFVCSGKGQGRIPEAEIMARLAVILGVPKEKIRIEANSNTTWEQALEVKKIFTNKNIAVGLVTSASHMKRAENEFRKYFLSVMPLPSNYLYSSPDKYVLVRYLPQAASLHKTGSVLKEKAGQIWYLIKRVQS
jgi:uncharacterized SAM-binding protein YcdF (DUF218 family)